jgi:hypothetical protein
MATRLAYTILNSTVECKMVEASNQRTIVSLFRAHQRRHASANKGGARPKYRQALLREGIFNYCRNPSETVHVSMLRQSDLLCPFDDERV